MNSPALKLEQKYTYKDYYSWNDNERWEIINGEAINMSPAPNRSHQKIILEISWQIKSYLRKHKDLKCEVYIAPFDVRLAEADETLENASNVVQPDISIFCDSKKLDKQGAIGAPDLVIEVLSPSTSRRDQTTKLALYERHGVKEYWLVHPEDRLIFVRLMEKGEYAKTKIFTEDDKVLMNLFSDLAIDMPEVFGELEN